MMCPATGKTMHTRKQAQRIASWWQRRYFARMTAYQCKSCRAYHVGNNTGGRRHRTRPR